MECYQFQQIAMVVQRLLHLRRRQSRHLRQHLQMSRFRLSRLRRLRLM